MGIHKLKKSNLIKYSLILLAFITAISLVSRGINFEEIKYFIASQGIRGQIVFVLIIFSGTVLAPVTSFPLWPVALFSYGFWPSVILTYMGSFTGGFFNFLIARKFGRPVVQRLVGPKTMRQIDKFTEISGVRAFIILRVLASNYFDYISFAAGLTTLKIKDFLLVSAPASFIWITFVYFFIKESINRLGPYAIIATLVAYGLGWIGLFLAYRMYRNVGRGKNV